MLRATAYFGMERTIKQNNFYSFINICLMCWKTPLPQAYNCIQVLSSTRLCRNQNMSKHVPKFFISKHQQLHPKQLNKTICFQKINFLRPIRT